MLMGNANKNESQQIVFSGSSLTHSGNKIIVGSGTGAVVSGSTSGLPDHQMVMTDGLKSAS